MSNQAARTDAERRKLEDTLGAFRDPGTRGGLRAVPRVPDEAPAQVATPSRGGEAAAPEAQPVRPLAVTDKALVVRTPGAVDDVFAQLVGEWEIRQRDVINRTYSMDQEHIDKLAALRDAFGLDFSTLVRAGVDALYVEAVRRNHLPLREGASAVSATE